MPATRASARAPDGEVGLDGGARDECDAVPGEHSAPHGLLQPELEADVEVAQPDAEAAELVLDDPPDPGALLHDHERLRDELVDAYVAVGEAMPRRAHEHDLVVRERRVADSAMSGRGSHDAELEPSLRDELHDSPRVVHLQRDADSGMRLLELAEELRHDDRRGAGRSADRERAGELSLGFGGQLVEHLRLEGEEPLRAAVQPSARLGGLDPSARAIEQLGP